MTKYKLPKEFATKWLEALRSGNYKQGMGLLYNEDTGSYCCLGVVCKLCNVNSLIIFQNRNNTLCAVAFQNIEKIKII